MNRRNALLKAGAAVAVLALLSAAPLVLSPYFLSMIITCLMYIGLTASWSLFSGPSGYISLGTYAFFGLGVYVGAIASGYLPWPVVVLAGGVIAMFYAVLIGSFILHLRGAYFAVLTFGLGQVAMLLVTLAEKTFAGNAGRVMTTVPSEQMTYWSILAVTAISAILFTVVRQARLGHALRAIGMDEIRAATFGVRPTVAKLAGFGLSALIAGAMGAALVPRWTYIEPASAFNPFIVFQTVLIAMVGGPLTLYGPIAASILFSVMLEAMRLNMPDVYMIILGVILVLSALYLPNGIASVDFGRLLAFGKRRIGL